MRKFLMVLLVLAFASFFMCESEAMMVSASKKVTAKDIDSLAKKNPRLVIVIDQKGCGACDVAKKFIASFDDQSTVYAFVDYKLMPKEYDNSDSTPTFLFFKNGKYVGQKVGVSPTAKALLDSFNERFN